MKRRIEPFGDGVVTLRLVEERDLPMLLEWRNRDAARVWFKTSGILTMEGHQAWFSRYSENDDDFFFIAEVDDLPVAQCAIYGIDLEHGSAEVGRFLIAPGCSGAGHVTRACTQIVRFAGDKLHLSYLFLEVMENNARAIRLYERCGFREESRSDGSVRMGFQRAAQHA